MAVRKDDVALLADLDRAVGELKHSGEFDRIIDRWSPRRLHIYSTSELGLAIAAGGLLAAAVFALGIAVHALRRKQRLLASEIARRARTEKELREATARAEDAVESRSKFLAAASHDLRQPLQSLLLFQELLAPHVAEDGREALKHLGRGLDALRELLNGLLDISRLDAGVVAPSIEDFALQDLIEQIEAAYKPLAAAKGDLTFHIDPCPAVVRSDPTLLGRMVRNLVENALRYTEAGRIDVVFVAGAGQLRIEVHDTGMGIAPEHLDRIWEEFHQLGNPERDRNRGLGLGLAIVRRLSVLLGHPVEVTSRPGRGSVFSITVPLGVEAPRQTQSPLTAIAGAGDYAVLIDDDPIVLLGLKTIFESWGFQVLAAGSIDQALSELERRPEIVVADYRLRDGHSGAEAIWRIRDLWGADVPGVVLTGDTGEAVRDDAAAHGLSVIYKPATPRQLAEILDKGKIAAREPS
ncbi:MAG: response regulator [Alphaproteobacteria bacterium]|nr:response regulator [Alphaproteobacteria bacterium]